jgi:hypothetical protein
MGINFDELCQEIETGVASLAKSSLEDYPAAAKAAGQTIVNSLKCDLQQWVADVNAGYLTLQDLNFLVNAEETLVELTALKQAGLAAERIDQFKAGVINIITGAIAGMIKV